jgi:hypothetical protein
MTGLFGFLGIVLLLVIAVRGLAAYGTRRWERVTQTLRGRLDAGRVRGQRLGTEPRRQFDARELEGLPAPVQRYFRTVFGDRQALIEAVTIDIDGVFNLSPTGEQWRPFTSRQRVITRRPGFLWDARIAMTPGVTVCVVDSYIAGLGLLHAAVWGWFTMAKEQGAGEIARGEFMRYFAEVAWYPTALLPSQGVRWKAVDAHSAVATMEDGALGLSLLFRFNDAGLIDSFRAEARAGKVGNQVVMAPWEGRWSNYQMHHGIQVPFTGEVAWMRPEGRKPYFIGTVTALEFEFSP